MKSQIIRRISGAECRRHRKLITLGSGRVKRSNRSDDGQLHQIFRKTMSRAHNAATAIMIPAISCETNPQTNGHNKKYVNSGICTLLYVYLYWRKNVWPAVGIQLFVVVKLLPQSKG